MISKLLKYLNFLKIKDLKELKENFKNPISRRHKELEQLFEVLGYSSNLNQVKN